MATPNQIAANLIINELCPRLDRLGIKIEDCPLPPAVISYLANMKSKGEIDTHSIRQILDRFFDTTG